MKNEVAEKTQNRRGRPLKAEADKKRHNQTVRIRGATRDKLTAAAAKNERSISEEIESRVDVSFQLEKEFGEASLLSFLRLIAGSAHMIAGSLGDPADAYELARGKPMARHAMQAAVIDLAERHLSPRDEHELDLENAGISAANGRQVAKMVDLKSAAEIRRSSLDVSKQLIVALQGIGDRDAYIAELETALGLDAPEKVQRNE